MPTCRKPRRRWTRCAPTHERNGGRRGVRGIGRGDAAAQGRVHHAVRRAFGKTPAMRVLLVGGALERLNGNGCERIPLEAVRAIRVKRTTLTEAGATTLRAAVAVFVAGLGIAWLARRPVASRFGRRRAAVDVVVGAALVAAGVLAVAGI